jgi:DNA mismatch repair protein MutS
VAKQLLEKNRSYTLFATHYFELTRIVDEFKYAANVHLDAVEHGNNIVFMHKVEEGAANQSYGLQVAQLAGIPRPVITAAKRKLAQLEVSQVAQQPSAISQTDMFIATETEVEHQTHPVIAELETMQVDDLTPKQALDLLYQLKELLDKN